MSEKFEIEFVSKHCVSLIGVAESASNVMDVATRKHPTGHIRIRPTCRSDPSAVPSKHQPYRSTLMLRAEPKFGPKRHNIV
jgi:hypothetical protein